MLRRLAVMIVSLDCSAIKTGIFITMTLCSCTLLKSIRKESDLEKQSASSEWNAKQSLRSVGEKTSSSILLRRDSGTNTFGVKIWPKGTFLFSIENGFNGTADSIAWYGNNKGLRATSSQNQKLEKINTTAKTTVKAISAEKAENTKKITESWLPLKWVLAGLLVIILVVWYVYKHILK